MRGNAMRYRALCLWNTMRYRALCLCMVMLMMKGAHASSPEQTCPKFSFHSNKVVRVVDGVCYYGLPQALTWGTARRRCQLQGTHLVHLQRALKQQRVSDALGPTFSQYWVGLQRSAGSWFWVYNDTYKVLADIASSRWESPTASGAVAMTLSTGNGQGLLKRAQHSWSYKFVCEDSAAAAAETSTALASTSAIPTSTSFLPTSTTPVPISTTSVPASSSADAIFEDLFTKTAYLGAVQCVDRPIHVAVVTKCAALCAPHSACHHFAFTSTTNSCQFYTDDDVNGTQTYCHNGHVCFTKCIV